MQRITLEELKHILYHAFRDHLTMKDIENIIINEEESLNETSGNCQTEFEGGKYPFLKIISTSFKKQMFILFFIFIYLFDCMGSWASLVAQMVKNMPAMWKTWVRFLGWEDPLEEGNPFQYSCLENPHGQRSLVGYSPWGHSQTRLKQLCQTWLSDEVHTWGLSCIMQVLLLWYIGSVVEVLGLGCSTACGSNLVPWPGVEPTSPTLQSRFLTTGPLGKFPVSTLSSALCLLWKRPMPPHPLDEKCVYRLLGWSGHGWDPQVQDQS